MSGEHPPKRSKANPIEEDIVDALSVVLDWIEQFPKQSTCHIILVSPKLVFSAKAKKGRRTPRLYKRDVTLDNHDWFASFPGKCNHSFRVAAAQNGDFLYLQTYVTNKYISLELHETALNAAMQNDDLKLLCWLRGFRVKLNRHIQSPELQNAIKYGSIKILKFLLAPHAIDNISQCATIHIRVFQWVCEQYPIEFEEWKADTTFMKCAATIGNVETLNYLHSQGFSASYKKLYSRALEWGRANVLEWVHDNLAFDYDVDLGGASAFDKKVAEAVLKHHPNRFAFWLQTRIHGPEVHWYCLKRGEVLSSVAIVILVCSNYWEKVRNHTFPNHPPFNVGALLPSWITALTIERLQYLLNCGLMLDDQLFQFILRYCTVEVCKFLWEIYNGNCKAQWPTSFAPSSENPAKWEWLQTIIPLASDKDWEGFVNDAIASKCISSFNWALPHFPEKDLWSVAVEVRHNVDFVIALAPYEFRRYPLYKIDIPRGPLWKTHKQIEFLVLNSDKLNLSKEFLPKWPNDFKFFQQNASKFEWGPQTGKEIRELFARTWSEENFQHWLERH